MNWCSSYNWMRAGVYSCGQWLVCQVLFDFTLCNGRGDRGAALTLVIWAVVVEQFLLGLPLMHQFFS